MIELLILYVLSDRELTMYSIQKAIHDEFGCFSKPSFGAIRPALTRLEKKSYIRSRRAMSDGGKQSGFYSVSQEGREYLKKLIMENVSENPLQFVSNASVKLACASYLPVEERKILFENIKKIALLHKIDAEKTLEESSKLNFYQKMMIDNIIVQYKNFAILIENFEKDLGKM